MSNKVHEILGKCDKYMYNGRSCMTREGKMCPDRQGGCKFLEELNRFAMKTAAENRQQGELNNPINKDIKSMKSDVSETPELPALDDSIVELYCPIQVAGHIKCIGTKCAFHMINNGVLECGICSISTMLNEIRVILNGIKASNESKTR